MRYPTTNISILLVAIFILTSCQTTPYKAKPKKLEKGEAYFCVLGNLAISFIDSDVLIMDTSGKKHERIAVITSVKKEIMKDNSVDYIIRYTEEVTKGFSFANHTLYFNTERIDGWMNGNLLYTGMYFPTVPKHVTDNLVQKVGCGILDGNTKVMTTQLIHAIKQKK